jgi:hypothetical protein
MQFVQAPLHLTQHGATFQLLAPLALPEWALVLSLGDSKDRLVGSVKIIVGMFEKRLVCHYNNGDTNHVKCL